MRFLVFLICSLLLFSCDKVKQTSKKITGTFEIKQYSYENQQGLTYFYTCNGLVEINKTASKEELNISVNLNCDTQETSPNMIGKIILNDDGEYFDLTRYNTDGTISQFTNGRIILRTKTDLKIEYYMESGRHRLVLRKND